MIPGRRAEANFRWGGTVNMKNDILPNQTQIMLLSFTIATLVSRIDSKW